MLTSYDRKGSSHAAAAEVLCKTGLAEARVMTNIVFQLPSIVGAEQSGRALVILDG